MTALNDKTKEKQMIQPINAKFELPAPPYAAGDLAPVLSQETIEFHYGKHLQTYLNNLNAALPGSAFEGKSIAEIVKTAEGGVFNNAGQFLKDLLVFLVEVLPVLLILVPILWLVIWLLATWARRV